MVQFESENQDYIYNVIERRKVSAGTELLQFSLALSLYLCRFSSTPHFSCYRKNVLIGKILRKLVTEQIFFYSIFIEGCEWGEAGKAVDRIPSEKHIIICEKEEKKNESQLYLH